MQVAGVDACRGGWVAVALEVGSGAPPGSAEAGPSRVPTEAVFDATLAGIHRQLPDVGGFAVDIPIGLPDDGVRQADVLVRQALGPRGSSLFVTPVRAALEEPTHARASAVARARTGQGVSQQAYGLRAKIFEAERWVEALDVPVWEVHPELCFTVLLGHPARAPKRTWTGMRERLQALEAAGVRLGDFPAAGSRAGVDDVLDAAAAGWSAARLVRGAGRSLPDPPERDARSGRDVAIWV